MEIRTIRMRASMMTFRRVNGRAVAVVPDR
jgi:hypothetical protein